MSGSNQHPTPGSTFSRVPAESSESSAPPATRFQLSQPNLSLEGFEERADEVIRLATEAFTQTGKWVLFYRELMGVEGVVRKLFPDTAELRRFETTPQFGQLLEMTAAMRAADTGKSDELEPQKMITVRLPTSQHEAMKAEAHEHGTSINKLCISKLLLPIAPEYVPEEKGAVRGRKPGPQGPSNRGVQPSSPEGRQPHEAQPTTDAS